MATASKISKAELYAISRLENSPLRLKSPEEKRKSLYDIPPGCICLGDGMLGEKCEAKEHYKLKE